MAGALPEVAGAPPEGTGAPLAVGAPASSGRTLRSVVRTFSQPSQSHCIVSPSQTTSSFPAGAHVPGLCV
jgi:hypothetical protein